MKHQNRRPRFSVWDRFYLSLFVPFRKSLVGIFLIVQPETVLGWYRHFLKLRWTFPHKNPGRKPITKVIKQLVLSIKKLNPWFGLTKIQGELAKVAVDLGRTSIQRILHGFRRDGTLQPWGSWKQFLQAHWNSLFACDFLTVDGVFGQRWYVFFLLKLKDRQVVHWGVTEYPTKNFLQQMLLAFTENRSGPMHLIHDHGPELMSIDYRSYGITNHPTCIASPNLNAYAERFVGTLRRECLDRFIVFTQRQLRNLIKAYVEYYNTRRPHQGLNNRLPNGAGPQTQGSFRHRSLCFDLVHDFYRGAS